MVFEYRFVKTWNTLSRAFGIGRPIFNFPAKANFLELSETQANKINALYMRRLPLSGTNFYVDVLNNRRHQVLGVFVPVASLVVLLYQFSYFQYTKAPAIVSQVPAPGWEKPKDMDYHHLQETQDYAAYWRKRTEMGHQEWDYGNAAKESIQINAHPWYHGQDQAGGHH